MKNLLELASILTIITFFGALFWAGLGMMAGGETNPDPVAREARATGASRAMIVAGISLVLFLIASRLRRRMD